MRLVRLAAVLCLSALAHAGAAAQIPDTFTNLQVLPKDISRNELVGLMRGFSLSLGVRCVHCHVGPANGSLQGADFASDDKDTKWTARTMLKMVTAINEEHLKPIGGEITVTCFTCHHGANRPERLEDVLVRAWKAGGPDSLLASYRGLRKAWYGRAAFDFGEMTLVETAGRLADRAYGPAGVQGAVAALRLQTELFPEFAVGWGQLGGTLAQAGDTAAAITALERALQLSPGNRQLEQMLTRIRGNRP